MTHEQNYHEWSRRPMLREWGLRQLRNQLCGELCHVVWDSRVEPADGEWRASYHHDRLGSFAAYAPTPERALRQLVVLVAEGPCL